MYELTNLFWYRPLFMTELLAAESVFFIKLRRYPGFVKRLIISILICYGVSFAFPVAFYNAAYCSFMFISLFVVTLLVGKIVFDEPFVNLLFCGIAGYATQHLAYEINDLLVVAFGFNGGAPLDSYASGTTSGDGIFPFIRYLADGYLVQLFLFVFIKYLMYVAVYAAVYYAAWELLSSRMDKYDVLHLKMKSILIFLTIIMSIAVVFSSVVTYSSSVQSLMSTERIMMYVYNITCCVLALYIQFELPRKKKLKRELEAVNELRYREREQYKLSRENIELINMKCHDMRHQIRSIAGISSINDKALNEINELISIYDTATVTGNKSVDTILTEKSLICKKNGIRLDCMADGKLLDFIEESDLYSLFGNLIENAIEAVKNLDPNTRTISLFVKRVNDMIAVCVRNPYSGVLKKDNQGFISTTKENKEYHGFGLRSIVSICEKYGGEASVNADNGVFTVNMVFPVKSPE